MVAKKRIKRVNSKRPTATKRRAKPVSTIRRTPDPFVRCVLGPVNLPSTGMGAPTGGTEPTVVIDHRSMTVIKPVNGAVCFAIIPGVSGCIALGAGQVTLSFPTMSYNIEAKSWLVTAPTSTTLTQTFTSPDGNNPLTSNYLVLPYKETLGMMGDYDVLSQTGLQFTKYRVLTSTANATFTGSTLYDAGTAATARVAYSIDEVTNIPSGPWNGTAGPLSQLLHASMLVQPVPKSQNDIVALPGSRTFSVREAVQMTNVPSRFDFQPVKQHWAPALLSAPIDTHDNAPWLLDVVFPNAVDVTNVGVIGAMSQGLGYGPVTFYYADGLSPDASITVDARCCIEYTLSFASPAARFATTPMPERPMALRTVRDIAARLPSSAPLTQSQNSGGWLGNALSWYGNTMRNIVGAVYSTAGKVIQTALPSPGFQAIGSMTNSLGQLMLTD